LAYNRHNLSFYHTVTCASNRCHSIFLFIILFCRSQVGGHEITTTVIKIKIKKQQNKQIIVQPNRNSNLRPSEYHTAALLAELSGLLYMFSPKKYKVLERNIHSRYIKFHPSQSTDKCELNSELYSVTAPSIAPNTTKIEVCVAWSWLEPVTLGMLYHSPYQLSYPAAKTSSLLNSNSSEPWHINLISYQRLAFSVIFFQN
jgi:hypothetical protein